MVTEAPAVDEGPSIVEPHELSTNSRHMALVPLTLNDLAADAQTTDPHVLLQHLLALYNNLVSEYNHTITGPPIHEHTSERGETIGLGVEGLSSPTSSFSGRLRNLRRRSIKSLRGEWHKTAHALSPPQDLSSELPQVPELMARSNLSVGSELPRALSPVSNASPRLWRKPSGSRMAGARVPDSPSQRSTPQSVTRIHSSASPNLSSRTLSSSGSRHRTTNSRPSTPVSRTVDDMASLSIIDHSHLSNAEIATYCSSVRTQGGVDVLTFRVRLVVNALPGDPSPRRRTILRVEKSYQDLKTMRERILVRAVNLAPGSQAPSLPLPDRSLFELPSTPWSLMERDHAVDSFLHAIQRLPGRYDDLLIQFFTTDQVHEPPMDPMYGVCLRQECLLKACGDSWILARCSLHTNTLIVSDPQSIGAPLVFDLRRTRIGRQIDHPAAFRDQGARFATIILQSIVPTSSTPSFVKLTTESVIQHTEWMSALLRESGEYPHEKLPYEPYYDPEARLESITTEVPVTPNRDAEGQESLSTLSPRSGKPLLLPQSPSKADIPRHMPGVKTRLRQNAENASNSPNMGERRRYLFGILPMSAADETHSKSVFGAPLAEAVLESGMPSASSGGLIPAVVQRCIEFLEGTDAMQEEGIYRVSGSSTGIKQLQERFILHGDVDLLAELHSTSKQRLGPWHDTHAVAGLLKLYLRILPENLCTEASLAQFSKSAEIQDREERCKAINSLMEELPSENFALLEALFSHLNHVQRLSAKNKMTPQNLGIVFSATLNMPVDLVVAFVSDYDAIFRSESAVPTALAVGAMLDPPPPALVDTQ